MRTPGRPLRRAGARPRGARDRDSGRAPASSRASARRPAARCWRWRSTAPARPAGPKFAAHLADAGAKNFQLVHGDCLVNRTPCIRPSSGLRQRRAVEPGRQPALRRGLPACSMPRPCDAASADGGDGAVGGRVVCARGRATRLGAPAPRCSRPRAGRVWCAVCRPTASTRDRGSDSAILRWNPPSDGSRGASGRIRSLVPHRVAARRKVLTRACAMAG